VCDHVEFVHPLLASGVYAAASPASRARVHRRLAEVVTNSEEQARHLALGTTEADAEVAAVLDAAADVAMLRGSPLTAAELYEHAVRLSPPSDADGAHRRRLEAARCYGLAGSTARGRELAEQVTTTAGPGETRIKALLLLGSVLFVDDVPSALQTLDQALREAAERPRLKAQALSKLATTHLGRLDVNAAVAHAGQALAVAEEEGDMTELSAALVTTGSVEVFAGRPEGIDLVERAVAIETTIGRRRVARAASGWVGTLLRWADDFDGARVRLEPLLRLADEVGDDSSVGELSYELSELECWAGNWQLAAQYAEAAVEIHRLAGRRWELSAALAALAAVEAHVGQVDSARAHASEGLALTRAIGAVDETVRNLRALGFLELSLGRPGQALEYLAEVASLAAAIEDPGVLRYAADHIEALIGVGDFDAAESSLSRLEHQARKLDRAWALAVAARCRGLMLLTASTDGCAALAILDEALVHHDRLPMPFERGRTLLVAGVARRRAKHLTDAHRILGEAQSTFETLGAPLWAAMTARERARIGGHLGRRRRTSLELTVTERRVAELVTAGATNPEVAATLFISRRTVEDHLSKIYRKLGVRSRTELAYRTATGSATASP
jgi:DNA-binding CsgD family transcriptional regulator/tetratricopeptide (TPR) repeat protein